jgi:regulator of sigma D
LKDNLTYLGIRGFTWNIGEPIILRYSIKDEELLRQLNIKKFDYNSESLIQPVSEEEFELYKRVMRVRETRVFDVKVKEKANEVYCSLKNILEYRLFAEGGDSYVYKEYPIDKSE